jgi:hypothetical protein
MEKLSKILMLILIVALASFAYLLLSGSILFSSSGLTFEGKESDFFVQPVTGETNISLYKNSCTEINLTDLSNNYKVLNGKKVKITGNITDKREYVQFDKTRTDLILKVPGLSPEPYIILVYTGTVPYNINDTITVYGEFMYPTGIDSPPELANKDLASIKVVYIEKN